MGSDAREAMAHHGMKLWVSTFLLLRQGLQPDLRGFATGLATKPQVPTASSYRANEDSS